MTAQIRKFARKIEGRMREMQEKRERKIHNIAFNMHSTKRDYSLVRLR